MKARGRKTRPPRPWSARLCKQRSRDSFSPEASLLRSLHLSSQNRSRYGSDQRIPEVCAAIDSHCKLHVWRNLSFRSCSQLRFVFKDFSRIVFMFMFPAAQDSRARPRVQSSEHHLQETAVVQLKYFRELESPSGLPQILLLVVVPE